MKNIRNYMGALALVAVLCMPHAADAWCYGCGDGGWGWGPALFGSAMLGTAIAASASRPRTVVVEQRADDSDEVAQLERENKKLRKQLKKQKQVEQEDREERTESVD